MESFGLQVIIQCESSEKPVVESITEPTQT